MDCKEITKAPIALQILQRSGDTRLQRLFHCIYSLFQSCFIKWIIHKYGHNLPKEKLWEDAKDAFQNGLMTLHHKAQQKEFTIKGSLKTTVYSFGILQLLASFKKEKHTRNFPLIDYEIVCAFEGYYPGEEQNQRLNEKEQELMAALVQLPPKLHTILMMKFFDKLKSKEIAAKMNVTAGNVDNDTAKAYKLLRSVLQSKSSFQKKEQWN
jgi:RNA polymerase sigma factor (sigma-70 family)